MFILEVRLKLILWLEKIKRIANIFIMKRL